MEKVKKLVKVTVAARNMLRQIANGQDNLYDRPNEAAAIVREINGALVPFVGIGTE